MGNSSCRRLWDEFAQQDPGNARLVIADVNADAALAVKANRHLDTVLAKSETKPKTKKSKAPKSASNEAWLSSLLTSPDPAEREAARDMLNERKGR